MILFYDLVGHYPSVSWAAQHTGLSGTQASADIIIWDGYGIQVKNSTEDLNSFELNSKGHSIGFSEVSFERLGTTLGFQPQPIEDLYSTDAYNIEYGWIDINGEQHLNTMKDFRRIYRTMSIDEILKYKIGTCIEQVNLMHYLLNKINFKNKMFCCRIFEPDDNGDLEEEEHMHCFVLYYENGKVYHMEHPNFEKKGIYEYNSEDIAIKEIVEYYIKLRGGKDSPTKEFFEIPVGISFKEFNKYINHI